MRASSCGPSLRVTRPGLVLRAVLVLDSSRCPEGPFAVSWQQRVVRSLEELASRGKKCSCPLPHLWTSRRENRLEGCFQENLKPRAKVRGKRSEASHFKRRAFGCASLNQALTTAGAVLASPGPALPDRPLPAALTMPALPNGISEETEAQRLAQSCTGQDLELGSTHMSGWDPFLLCPPSALPHLCCP